jgi:ferric-dicitrate binding protein FerR (iron transport regulator)
MARKEQYIHYEVEDFIRDEYFQDWVLSAGEGSGIFWKNWMDLHPYKKETIMEAVDFIRRLKFETVYPTPEQIEISLQRQLSAIGKHKHTPVPVMVPESRRRKRYMVWIAAAACLGCICWAGVKYGWITSSSMQVYSQAAIKKVILPDSSVVTLNAHSTLKWSKGFMKGQPREVWLQGEAFFDVRHQAAGRLISSPFIVHTHDLHITVLGTKFNVSNGSGFTNVVLDQGRIKVIPDDTSGRPRYLNPGELFRYEPAGHREVVREVKSDLYTSWKDEKITLNKVPLTEIAQMIQDVYGDSVRFLNPGQAKSMISGTLRITDEQSLLETLAFVLDMDIKKEDHLIVFSAK